MHECTCSCIVSNLLTRLMPHIFFSNEPENVLYSEFNDGSKYLFVLSERSSVVFVYDSADPTAPVLLQILPCTSGPEGMVAIPERNLLAVASEVDERENKIRASVAIYEFSDMDPVYPSIISDTREDGTFIPFAALSGLSVDPNEENILYTVEDSFSKKNRVLTIDISSYPAVIKGEFRIMDSNEVMKECVEAAGANATTMINDDMTVNIDPEGISVQDDGSWVVSEGAGTIGDEEKPFVSTYVVNCISDSDGGTDSTEILAFNQRNIPTCFFAWMLTESSLNV